MDDRRQGFEELASLLRENGESARRVELIANSTTLQMQDLKEKLTAHDNRQIETGKLVAGVKEMQTYHTETLHRIGLKVDETGERVARLEEGLRATTAIDKEHTDRLHALEHTDDKVNVSTLRVMVGSVIGSMVIGAALVSEAVRASVTKIIESLN